MILRPVRPGDRAALREARRTPEVVRWWGDEPDEPVNGERLAIEVDGAVAGLIQWGEHGHHRVTIYADAENAPAIRCYEGAGYRRVGVLEASARLRGEWRDEVLLEFVVRPPRAPH